MCWWAPFRRLRHRPALHFVTARGLQEDKGICVGVSNKRLRYAQKLTFELSKNCRAFLAGGALVDIQASRPGLLQRRAPLYDLVSLSARIFCGGRELTPQGVQFVSREMIK